MECLGKRISKNSNNRPTTNTPRYDHSQRLKSRKQSWKTAAKLIHDNFNVNEMWQDEWSQENPDSNNLIDDPSSKVPGFDLPRKQWSMINRFRTGHGRCGYVMHKWRATDDAVEL